MRINPVDRLWNKIERTESCWWFLGAKDSSGYGLVKDGIGRRHQRAFKAHRLAYMLFYGPIPDGMQVCHHCDHPACVNPEHLFLGTLLDNMHDRDRKGRLHHVVGEGCPQSKLTRMQVEFIKDLVLVHHMRPSFVAKQYDLSQTSVSRIVTGKNWKEP
jgi:hypothetical protein